jgi:tRNA(Ile2) C34 agmatinyltransferase TiaS
MVRRDKPVYTGKDKADRRTPKRPFERKKTCPSCGWKGNLGTDARCDHCGYRWPVDEIRLVPKTLEVKQVTSPFKGLTGVLADPQIAAKMKAAARAAEKKV